MALYISVPFIVDATELEQVSFDAFQTAFPGWEPNQGNPDVILLRATAAVVADGVSAASKIPDTIFRYSGRSLHGLPPVDAQPSTGAVTFTAVDTAGYVIPANTQLSGTNPDGETVAFTTLAAATIPAASSTVVVSVQAAEDGVIGNGISGFGNMEDNLDFLQGVEFTTTTSGGTDREDDETYLNRLRDELALQAPRPILPRDFAALARRQTGVHRAVAIDGLNPNAVVLTSVSNMAAVSVGSPVTGAGIPASTTVISLGSGQFTLSANATATATSVSLTSTYRFNQERTLTVAAIDEAGNAVSTAVKNAIQADLDAKREITFEVFVIDPTVTTINVTFTATSYPGYDAQSVDDAIVAAVQGFLSAGKWGTPPNGDDREWLNRTTVLHNEVEGVIYRVPGVRELTALTLNGGTSNIVLTGLVPLPAAGTVTGTVTATTN
jgi:hypothetical protein